MKNRIVVLLFVTLLLRAGGVIAQQSDRVAILTVMEKTFSAVRSQNPDDWRAIQLAEGTTLSFRALPDGPPDALDLMRISNNEEFIVALQPDGHEYTERWTGEPTILIRAQLR